MKHVSDNDAPLSRWWTLPTLALGCLNTVATRKIAPFAVAEALGMCSAVSFFVMVSIWHLRPQQWFWPFVAAAVTLQGAVIWLAPWPADHVFQKADLNFVWIDLIVLVVVGTLIERLMRVRRSDPNGS